MILQNTSLNTSVDVIRVPKACTSEKYLQIVTLFLRICLLSGEISSELKRKKILKLIY